MTLALSIVIPIYNEAAIVRSALVDLIDQTRSHCDSFEVIVAANGCNDGRVRLVQALQARTPELRLIEVDEPNYGRALREGLLAATGAWVICEEIDLCDSDFHVEALGLLRAGTTRFVIGSKRAVGAADERPRVRQVATQVMSGLLRLSLGFKGTDTHGLKAFSREDVLPVVQACQVEHDLFASELVIRAQRAGIPMKEIPVRVLEKRPPSVHLFRRVPRVLRDLGRLVRVLGPRA